MARSFEKDDVVDVKRGAVTYRRVWIRAVADDGTLTGSYRTQARRNHPAHTGRVSFRPAEVTAWYPKVFSRYGG